VRDGYIRLLVTRGVGTLGLNPKSCKEPSVIIIAGKIQLYPQEYYEKGLDIITVPTVRNLHSALNPAIKSLNY
jgi:branched-chain amino acid aminotransferase